MKITYKDYVDIQKLKKQGLTRNETVLKTKYTQYVVYKYWDMPEDVFLKEKDQTKSEYSKYRDIIVEIITENNTLPASVIYDRLKEWLGDTERLASMNSFYRYLKDLKRRMGLSDKKVSVRQMVNETQANNTQNILKYHRILLKKYLTNVLLVIIIKSRRLKWNTTN